MINEEDALSKLKNRVDRLKPRIKNHRPQVRINSETFEIETEPFCISDSAPTIENTYGTFLKSPLSTRAPRGISSEEARADRRGRASKKSRADRASLIRRARDLPSASIQSIWETELERYPCKVVYLEGFSGELREVYIPFAEQAITQRFGGNNHPIVFYWDCVAWKQAPERLASRLKRGSRPSTEETFALYRAHREALDRRSSRLAFGGGDIGHAHYEASHVESINRLSSTLSRSSDENMSHSFRDADRNLRRGL